MSSPATRKHSRKHSREAATSREALESGAPTAALRRALLAWYDREGRKLPWRARPSAYGTVVSEFMLQQTQIATVIPYYHAFLRRFPDFEALAAAREDDVLAAWSGLGYYRRARLLKGAAEAIARDHAGRLPEDAGALRALPGFGPYTTAAVGAIALGLPLAAIDGNIRRVMARLYAIAGAGGQARIEAAAQAALDPIRPGDWNQALMDLGATVCVPRDPRCGICPLEPYCAARREGRLEMYPEPKPAPATVRVRETAVAVMRRGAVLLLRRPAGGAFGGMWELPRMDNRRDPAAQPPAPARVVEELTGIKIRRAELIGSANAIFTHHRIRMELHKASALAGAKPRLNGHDEASFFEIEKIEVLPMSRAQRRLVEMIFGAGKD